MAFGNDPKPEFCNRNNNKCTRRAVSRILVTHGASCGGSCCGESAREARTDTEVWLLCQVHLDGFNASELEFVYRTAHMRI